MKSRQMEFSAGTPSVRVVAAALAMAEREGRSGEAML